MSLDLDDTIAALCSAPGPAARGIIRIGGPGVREALVDLFMPEDPHAYAVSKTASRHPGSFKIATSTVPVPADVYYWPDHRSYTGGRQAEIHTVGSPPLLDAMLAALHARGVRPARPGEFTLRAFLAGRIDLVEAEAVLGVIDANSHVELEMALRQLAGGLSGPLAQVREDLLGTLADIEAELDFVEEDIQFIAPARILERIQCARRFLEQLLEQSASRMQTHARFRIVLAGLPNAGKSTLFNALARTNAALVSPVSGTTRDYLRADVEWNGLAIELIDTAGCEASMTGPAEAAQQFREQQLDLADLIVWCTAIDIEPEDVSRDVAFINGLVRQDRPVMQIVTKADCLGTMQSRLSVSAATGAQLAELTEAIVAKLGAEKTRSRQMLGSTASRCRDSLANATDGLRRAETALTSGHGYEILAVDLRQAVHSLGEILGRIYTDDILDRIFSKFCIGK